MIYDIVSRKRGYIFWMVWLVVIILTGWFTTWKAVAEGITLVDDIGQKIELDEPAKRIISLYSAHTENLFALGLDREIIGVGKSDVYPPKACEKNVYDWKSDPEKVIAANPDMVLIRPFIKRSQPEFVEILETAGLHIVALYPETFEEFDEYIVKLGLLTGKEEKAEELLKNFHQAIEDIQTFIKDLTPKVNIYFESVERGYKTVTPDSMPGRAIEIAGGINIAKNAMPITRGSSIAAYGVERILEHADDIDVFVSQRGVMNTGGSIHSISVRPGFHAIKAVKNKRVYEINEKIISSPTFRYIKGIQELARMFYPDVADDISGFRTDDAITREKMAEIVVRFKHRPLFILTTQYYRKKHKGHIYGTFKDIDIQTPSFDFVETAVLSGYMEGFEEHGDAMFYPERRVTRDEFARILFMLHDFDKVPQHIMIQDIENTLQPKIVQIIVDHGLIDCKDGYFFPEQLVTGKEVVETLNRLKEL